MAEPKRRRHLRRIGSSHRVDSSRADRSVAAVDVLPPMFDVIAEAIGGAEPAGSACDVVGRDLAALGVSLDEALRDLQVTTRVVAGRDPSFDETHALSLGWSEATLGYLHGLSCVDPLTGLTTQAHLREAIAVAYRDGVPGGRALIVIDSAEREAVVMGETVVTGEVTGEVAVSSARTMTILGQHARAIFAGDETISQVGTGRIVVLGDRTQTLGDRVALLRRMAGPYAGRVWIEGLPTSESSAAFLLDELARASH